jgi:2-phospho-L-lactate guanylyltransferase
MLGQISMNSPFWAVLPVKDLVNAKQRLSAVLDGEERRELFRAMLLDVLTALSGVGALSGILVVTRDEEAQTLARRFDARLLVEDENLGQTEAVTFGVTTLAAEGVDSMVAVPADVPLVKPEDITALLRAHAAAPSVTIAPARDRLGSNAVACSPPHVLPFRFGANSFYPHLERARGLGIEPQVVDLRRLGLDIDTPDDLAALLKEAPSTRAHAYLNESGVAQRLTAL